MFCQLENAQMSNSGVLLGLAVMPPASPPPPDEELSSYTCTGNLNYGTLIVILETMIVVRIKSRNLPCLWFADGSIFQQQG